jgi:hypothetical protein
MMKTNLKVTDMTTFDFGDGPVAAHRHPNGGGWVADTATVADTAYVGPGRSWYMITLVVTFGCPITLGCPVTLMYGNAEVSGNARVSGNALVYDDAQVSGTARVSGDAQVYGNAMVSYDIYGVR